MNIENNGTQNADHAQHTDADKAAIHGVVDSLVGLGTVWAQHGVEIGRLALKTQSTWLRTLSGLLNQLADSMEPLTRVHERTAPNAE